MQARRAARLAALCALLLLLCGPARAELGNIKVQQSFDGATWSDLGTVDVVSQITAMASRMCIQPPPKQRGSIFVWHMLGSAGAVAEGEGEPPHADAPLGARAVRAIARCCSLLRTRPPRTARPRASSAARR